MKKEQKFEARLKETGLFEEWNNQGCFGRVATTDDKGNIILFVHEDRKDSYTEFHYPPFQVLRQNYKFVKACILEWRGYDGDFEKRLDDWLAYGMCSESGCPLYPVDVYFPADGLQTFSKDFEDDRETLWDAINEDEFKAYDALAKIIKDFYAPDDDEEANRIEDRFNGKFSEFIKEMDEYMATK